MTIMKLVINVKFLTKLLMNQYFLIVLTKGRHSKYCMLNDDDVLNYGLLHLITFIMLVQMMM